MFFRNPLRRLDDRREMIAPTKTLHAGEWVEVRPLAEILATLDAEGELDKLPFMPEMARFAGRRFRVGAVAHKTCDTVNRTGGRRMRNAVHLENLRCDGSSHGGCQAQCLLFWKTAWLRPAGREGATNGAAAIPAARVAEAPATATAAELPAGLVDSATHADDSGETVYRCQATRLYEATSPLAWWDPRQYWEDVRSGNHGVGEVAKTLLLAAAYKLRRLPVGYRISCRLYDRLHRLLRGQPDPHIVGPIPRGSPTPEERLGLAPGEVVEIRSAVEIRRTLDTGNRNRGLNIDSEMTIYCGQRHRVASRVERIINEQTGRMMHFKNPCIVLEGVDCLGRYSDRRLMCPRRITAYWREIWLKRAADGDQP